MRFARRFVLPLVLLVASVAFWVAADQLGKGPSAAASTTPIEPLELALFSVGRLPEYASESLYLETAEVALGELPGDPGGLSCVSVLIDGQPFLETRAEQPLVPGFAQLLLTGHAAIDILGPDYTYETRVMAEELPDEDGRMFSDVFLVGGGDPVLMSYGYSVGFRPVLSTRTSIEALAERLAERGITRIDGSVVAIERRYDTERTLPGWPAELVTDGVVGPLTAMQLDDGFAERAAANNGVAVPSEDPAATAAERFDDLLEERDISVGGVGRSLGADDELPELVPVASIRSPRLADIVFQMLAANDATAAEMIIKELGNARGEGGTTQAGGRAIQQMLETQGVAVALPPRDGSGLDPVGGTSCSLLAKTMDSIPADHPTLDVLPSYDLPGVFDGRFSEIVVEADLRLVGGAVGDASGFVSRTLDEGRRITIASIINRPNGPTENDLAYQDALVELVDELR